MWAFMMGKHSGTIENPFIYDDYINGSYWQQNPSWGDKRKDAPYKIGEEYEH